MADVENVFEGRGVWVKVSVREADSVGVEVLVGLSVRVSVIE